MPPHLLYEVLGLDPLGSVGQASTLSTELHLQTPKVTPQNSPPKTRPPLDLGSFLQLFLVLVIELSILPRLGRYLTKVPRPTLVLLQQQGPYDTSREKKVRLEPLYMTSYFANWRS